MTRRRHDRRRFPTLLGVGAFALLLPLALGGCDKGEEQVQAPPPAPPPRRLDPLEDLDMDPRVQFPEARDPSTRELAEAIADFASAFVSGDDAILTDMLDDQGEAVLSRLKSTGQWSKETSRIEAVRVCVLKEDGDECTLGLGVQDPDGAYMLAWTGESRGDSWVFSPMPVEDIKAPSLSMLDDIPLVAPTVPSPVQPSAFGASSASDDG